MSARADLTDARVDGWIVLVKAPAQARVPFWTCTHEPCGIVADLPHVVLTKALAGKGTLPACTTCVPVEQRSNIDHGLHLGCGTAHLIGTPCPADPRCSVVAGKHVIEPSVWDQFEVVEEPAPLVAPTSSFYGGHPSENLMREAEAISDELLQAITPTREPVVIHGRVDRLEEPQDALDVIRRAMAGQQRNHQSEPGPSQFGGCERRLGYHLATGNGNGSSDDGAWRPQVGTAVHNWLDEVFTREGRESGRWISDYRVTNPVAGKADLVDTTGFKVIDFKCTGKATRDKAARGQVSDKYEVQLDLYALGLINDGYRIDTVALLLLPASGSLAESVWYERPVNLDRAREAVARRDRINAVLDIARRIDPMGGECAALESLSTSDDWCASCPALGSHCKGFEGANLWGAPDPVWPAYDAAVKAAS